MELLSDTLPRMASGVDALYYFAQTNGTYPEFFENLLSQIQDQKNRFEGMNYAYKENDLHVALIDFELTYSGTGRDGFVWFNHLYFRMGFKDPEKNPAMHNIRVQLNAVGIYTLGLKGLLNLINTHLIRSLITGYFPITRIDLNTFVQYDFSYLRKEMVVSKKKGHEATLGERMGAYELETYYVGKKPFKLRIYNKKKELRQAPEKKQEVMYRYFKEHRFDMDKAIFNVEFEMHREFLKNYGIDTIEDALKNAVTLFEFGCQLVRIIDPDTVTETELNSSNRRRAKNQPIWSLLANTYTLAEFEQRQTPLEKIERVPGRYSLQDAEKSIKKVLMRLHMNHNAPTFKFILDIHQRVKEEYTVKQNLKSLHEEHKAETFEESLKGYSDEGLEELFKALEAEWNGLSSEKDPEYELVMQQQDLAYKELVRRGLAPEF